jgi:hypothetical protein
MPDLRDARNREIGIAGASLQVAASSSEARTFAAVAD